MKTRRGVNLVLMIVGLAAGSLCSAQTIYVDDDAAVGGDGKRWESAYCFLQDALAEAATSAGPVEIRIAQGSYRPDQGGGHLSGDRGATFTLLNNVSLVGGYVGLGQADPNVRDVVRYRTALSGDLNDDDGSEFNNRSDNSYAVVTSASNDASAVLDGVWIMDGNGPRGAGLSCYGGSPTIVDCAFAANTVVGWDSATSEGDGGAVYCADAWPTFERCRFEYNRADSDGGAIWCRYHGGITLSDCTFHDNAATGRGGAIGCLNSSLQALACTFDDNHADAEGGALYLSSEKQRLSQCRFLNNSAGYGGAIYNLFGEMSITGSDFSGNQSATEGGAVYNDSASSVYIGTTLFAGNRALYVGGGMYNWCDSDPNVVNCTFADNRAPLGSALAAGLPIVTNCIIWSQDADEAPVLGLGDGPTITYSCVQGGWPGEGNMAVDPCFAAPGVWLDVNETPDDPNDDEWVDGDYHLMSQVGRWDPNESDWVLDTVDSPCIDAGDPNVPVCCEPLPHGDRVNLGAYGGTSEAGKSYHGTASYEFVSDRSTLLQSGGFAGVHWTYRIEGAFGLIVDYENSMARFVDVQATATDVDNPERTVDFQTGLVLTSLAGTIQADGSISFTGTATDGSSFDVQCTLSGNIVELSGQTTPPPNSADFFIFSLDALAIVTCPDRTEACAY